MLCNHCGSQVPDGSTFCNRCGQVVSPEQSMSSTAGTLQEGLQRKNSSKAVASLITGVLFFILPSSIAAVVLGHIARREIRKSAGRLQGSGMALAGLIMGYIGLALPFILIISAIVIPNLLRAKIAANESSAVSSLRLISVAEVRYFQLHPDTGFTCNLGELKTGDGVDGQLASGTKYGYAVALRNCKAATVGGPNRSYQLTAHPLVVNTTGVRAFCSDQSRIIRSDPGGSEENCLKNGQPL